MRTADAMFTSKRADWATPARLFARLDREFRFTLDACASAGNAKVSRFITAEQDALREPWTGVVWCNPPYGPGLPAWVRKARESAARGATVVLLVPARTDTTWWHVHAMRAAEVRFIQRRIRFEGAPHTAPFPSVLIVFRPGHVGVPRLGSYRAKGEA